MKLNIIGNKTKRLAVLAQQKFQQLMLELALNNNNIIVGSGLGGNNEQLKSMMHMYHTLSGAKNRKILFYAKKPKMYWGDAWLAESSMKDIRQELDRVFSQISPSEIDFVHSMNTPNSMLYNKACESTVSLSQMLDKKEATPMCIAAIGNALETLPSEVVLLAVRQNIGINRLVIHDLDEDPVFGKLLNKINKQVDT